MDITEIIATPCDTLWTSAARHVPARLRPTSRISAAKSREKAGKRDEFLDARLADERWNASIPRENESSPRQVVKSDTYLRLIKI